MRQRKLRMVGIQAIPISTQNLSPDREYSPCELLRKYDVAEKNADAMTKEVLDILNKYMPSDKADDLYNKDGQIYALRLVFGNLLNKFYPTL